MTTSATCKSRSTSLATADQLKQKVEELQALISSNKSDITSLQNRVG